MSPSATSRYCARFALSRMTPEQFAWYALSYLEALAEQALDELGSYPSAEPELRALQEASA